MNSWLYILDEFKPLNVSYDEILHYLDKDPVKLLKLVLVAMDGELGDVENYRVYDVYRDPGEKELLIELLISCSIGEILAKIIASPNPQETLRKYYEREESRKHGVETVLSTRTDT